MLLDRFAMICSTDDAQMDDVQTRIEAVDAAMAWQDDWRAVTAASEDAESALRNRVATRATSLPNGRCRRRLRDDWCKVASNTACWDTGGRIRGQSSARVVRAETRSRGKRDGCRRRGGVGRRTARDAERRADDVSPPPPQPQPSNRRSGAHRARRTTTRRRRNRRRNRRRRKLD